MNDGNKVHVEYMVDTTKPGTLTQDGLLWVSDLRDSERFEPTGHFR